MSKKAVTQKDRVIDYMQKYGVISPLDAFRDLGITKLATVISKMIRVDGIKIEKIPDNSLNRWGEKVHYMSYRLGE